MNFLEILQRLFLRNKIIDSSDLGHAKREMDIYVKGKGATHSLVHEGMRVAIKRKKIPENEKYLPRSVWTISNVPDKKPLPIKPVETKQKLPDKKPESDHISFRKFYEKKKTGVKKFRINKIECLEKLYKFEHLTYLRSFQLRKIFNRKRRTIDEWQRTRGLKPVKIENKRKFWSWLDVYSWICEQNDINDTL